jgi:hypothetical protein
VSVAVAGAAVAAALLVVPAHAAPAPSGPSAVRVVTPPTQVSRAALVRLMRHAGKATDRGLATGARMRTTVSIMGTTVSATGRTVGGRTVTRTTDGRVTIADYRTGTGYAPISDVVDGLGVTPEQLSAALASLGKPGATWVVITGPGGGSGTPSSGADLVRQARTASTWTWKRAHGITTWRLGKSRAALPWGLVVALDKRQRIVRESLTASTTKPVKISTSMSIRVRYGTVAPITLPTAAQSVDLDALLEALKDGGDALAAQSAASLVVASVQTQIMALRTMSGR